MKSLLQFIGSRLIAGVLVVAPVYLVTLLLLRAMKSLMAFVRPLAKLLPEWLPADRILSLLLVLIICFVIGLAMRTRAGQLAWERMENSLFQRIPGYTIVRSFTRQLAGTTQDEAWKPALAEIEQALVPAFIIEELEDGRLTVFVPSVPTAISGAIYILSSDRVHPVNVPVTHVIRAVCRWGSGSRDLVAAAKGRNMSDQHTLR